MHLNAAPTLVSEAPFTDFFGTGSGVDNPYRAVVHVIIRSHGVAEADPADLAVQTSTFGGFCNLPGVVCANVGVAVLPDPPPPGKP